MTRLISFSFNKLLIGTSKIRFDAVGAFSSTLCMIHCIATPIFFIASTCSASCCAMAPAWWQWLDYLFLFISFFAIQRATKSSVSDNVVIGLWSSWVALFVLIINIKLQWFQIAENLKFIPAFALVLLHLYNMKFCQCESNECC